MEKFKQEILEKIREDHNLYMIVVKLLDIDPVSLPVTLKRNGATLNQYSIVKTVADYLGKAPEELVESGLDEEAIKVSDKITNVK